MSRLKLALCAFLMGLILGGGLCIKYAAASAERASLEGKEPCVIELNDVLLEGPGIPRHRLTEQEAIAMGATLVPKKGKP